MTTAIEAHTPGEVAAARKRRAHHLAQVASATTWKQPLWSTYGFITAEARHLSPAERAELQRELLAIAIRLNAANGGGDDRT